MRYQLIPLVLHCSSGGGGHWQKIFVNDYWTIVDKGVGGPSFRQNYSCDSKYRRDVAFDLLNPQQYL